MNRHRQTANPAVVILALALALIAGACSIEETLPRPHCEEGGSGLIVAQSVPSASQVPCLQTLPAGWSVASVSVDQSRTVITLDSDRAGDEAAELRYEASCDVSTAASAPSDLAGAERFDLIEALSPGFRARRFYLFPGGCVTWVFDFDRSVSATESVAIGEVLDLVSREDLNRSVRESFLDREL